MDPVIPSSDYKAEFTQGPVKAAITATGAKENSLLMVPVEKLVVPAGLNVRIHDDDYEARIDEVCTSIIENGFYRHMPLPGYAAQEGSAEAKQSLIYITGGFTRLAAVKRAIEQGTPIEAVPVVLKPNGTSMLDLNFALANDNTGAPLNPYEKGIIVKRALGYGADEALIARKMNVSGQYVKDLLYLHSLPMATQQMVIKRQIGAGHAIKMSRQHGQAEALKIMQEAMAEAGAAEGEGEPESAGAAQPAARRVTPRQTRAAAGTATTGTGVKERLTVAMAAIDYAIALPGDGIDFLNRWRKEDADALAEVMATLQPAAKPLTKKAQADAKRKEKADAKAAAEAEKAAKKAAAAKKKADAERKKADRAAATAAATGTAAAKSGNSKDASDIDL